MPVTVLGLNTPVRVDFVHDVAPGALAAGLQRRDLPRLGPGEERLQALAARLRPDLRRPGADRRPRRAARQPRLARRQPDAAQAHRRGAARRRRADPAGRAVLRDPPLLDRRRRQARPDHAAGDQDRGLPGQPGRPADRRRAAAPRAGDLRQRRGPRRDPRGVHRERQHRGRHGRPVGPDDRAAPRRGADPGPLRGDLRLDHADRHGRPHRLRLDRARPPTARSTSWSPPSGSG